MMKMPKGQEFTALGEFDEDAAYKFFYENLSDHEEVSLAMCGIEMARWQHSQDQYAYLSKVNHRDIGKVMLERDAAHTALRELLADIEEPIRSVLENLGQMDLKEWKKCMLAFDRAIGFLKQMRS